MNIYNICTIISLVLIIIDILFLRIKISDLKKQLESFIRIENTLYAKYSIENKSVEDFIYKKFEDKLFNIQTQINHMKLDKK
jgi:hypothetical protein